jgi:hypothetical protein
MADEEAKVLATAKKLALSERVQHKLWKVRSEAWEDIRAGCERAFSSSDPVLEETGTSVLGAVTSIKSSLDSAWL